MPDKSALIAAWQRLQQLRDSNPIQRGFDPESLIFALATSEGLTCRPSFRTRGEQVDGLIQLDGRFILVEAKWRKAKLPASEVYGFRAKVEGKPAGTLGVFVAVNGFADDVPDALRFGKELNVLLCVGSDVELALEDRYSLTDVLRAKLLGAAQFGEVLYAYQRYLDESAV
jgi:hypothetical protein